MKRGFALIEVVLGIAISSILGIVLYTIINQIYRSEAQVRETISVGMRVALVQERLQRDLSGMSLLPEIKKPEQPATSEVSKGQKQVQKPVEELEFEPAKPVEQQLLSISQDDGSGGQILKDLTFLTCNPLQVYGDVKPRITRVVYTLQADQPNSWSLFRQESIDLNYIAAKASLENYNLINGIKKLVLTYHFVPQEGDEGEPKQLTNLESEQQTELPKYVEVDLELWEDDRQDASQEFKFWYMPIQVEHISKKPKLAEGDTQDESVAKLAKRGMAQ